MSERDTLIAGASLLGVTLGAAQADAALGLLDELERWSRSYNLTAITERDTMITHHLLDSLSVAPWIRGQRVLDVGTGAGFPGLPLAIAMPTTEFTLLDSNGKKVRFVAHVARALGLVNVTTVHARAESIEPPPGGYDVVIARACAPLAELVPLVTPACRAGTRVLAMKGRRQAEERAGIPAGWTIEADPTLVIPGLGEERHLVVLRPPVG